MRIQKSILSFGLFITLTASGASMAFTNMSVPAQSSGALIHLVAQEALEEEALAFIKNLAKTGIGILSNGEEDARQSAFRTLLHDNFDMKTIGRFALGKYWKTTSKDEQKEYLTLFEDMIVKVYSRRFGDYNGEELKITTARKEGDKDVLVSSVIIPNSGPQISVDWRVRKNKGGKYKVIDIMVEGVSMSLTQRSDFSSVIQRGGGKIDVLLDHLRG